MRSVLLAAAAALAAAPASSARPLSRRALAGAVPAALLPALGAPCDVARAEDAPSSLSQRLKLRSAAALKKPVFNLPPGPTAYPARFEGVWDVVSDFIGYELPSAKLSRSQVLNDLDIPGFQKASVAYFSDVGITGVKHRVSFSRARASGPVLEDRSANLRSSIDAHLGYEAVDEVLYDGNASSGGNPNRASVIFRRGKTRNAERIELFANSREAEELPGAFFCSEYLRQTTFSASQQPGVARQVVGDYQHFYSYALPDGDEGRMRCNVLTACYLNPTDALFFSEPNLPVIVYGHTQSYVRVA